MGRWPREQLDRWFSEGKAAQAITGEMAQASEGKGVDAEE